MKNNATLATKAGCGPRKTERRSRIVEETRLVLYVLVLVRAGASSPSVRHCSGHAIGRSMRRLRPQPRGRRRLTAALAMSGARNASDRVIRIVTRRELSSKSGRRTAETIARRAGYGNLVLIRTQGNHAICADFLVELRGFEPLASAVRLQRSPI
jgi:hypothetical protein